MQSSNELLYVLYAFIICDLFKLLNWFVGRTELHVLRLVQYVIWSETYLPKLPRA